MLIDELQDWYRNNNNGSLEIGDVDATFLGGFPNVGFTIKDVYQTSFDTILDKNSSIFIKKAQVSISAIDVLSGEIAFRNIQIDHAEITSEVISEKSIAEYIRLKKQRQAASGSGLKLPGWLHPERTNFSLKDVSFIAKDTMLNKYFNLNIVQAKGRFRSKNEMITGVLNFKVMVNNLGFNTKKGSYINGAMITGSPEFILDREISTLDVSEFQLKIDDHLFETKADFDFTENSSYRFSLQNQETSFKKIKELLPDSLSAKLSNYEILEPISTELKLDGKFLYGDIPNINGSFSAENNIIRVGDSIQLNKVRLSGYLTNHLNQDSEIPKPSRRDIRVFFENLSGEIKDIEISANNSYYQSSAKASNFINANLKMSGSNETLARLLQNDNFNFIGGNFNLETHINGNIPSKHKLFNFATGRFSLNNTRVVLKRNNLQLPVDVVELRLDNENSVLEQLKIDLPNGDHLIFKGNIKNVSSILEDNPLIPAIAEVSLDSDKLNLNELIATAMEFIPSSEKANNELKTLHETFEAIYQKFQPRFKLNLRTIEYDSISFKNLIADVQLLDAETVRLNDLNFDYNNAKTELNGTLKIPKPDNSFEEPLYVNVKANSSGPMKVFQDLFNIELLDIKAGKYSFSGNVTGNISKFEQLLNNVKGDLKLVDTQFYYPKAAMDFDFDSLTVAIEDANINLERFLLEVDNHYPIALQSRITEFPGFLLDHVKSDGRVFIGMDAAFIDMDDWMKSLESIESNNENKTPKNRELAAIFNDIYKFNPEFTLKLDSLKYKKLVSNDISAKVYFKDNSTLKLDDLKIRYKNSEATIRGNIAAKVIEKARGNQNPFNFEFSAEAKGQSRDLNDLLKTVNFYLRSGDFKFDGSYKGEARDLKILNSNAQGDLSLGETMVDIEAAKIQVPIDSLHLVIKNNLATLVRLDVSLPGKSSIDITGEIDNFSNFINNEQTIDSHKSTFNIKSPYLNSEDIKKFLVNTSKDKDSAKSQKLEVKNLKEILSDINNSYFPSANIEIDSLVYNNLAVSGFTSNIDFDQEGTIRVSNTQLQYFGGSINLMLEAGVSSQDLLPAKLKLNVENMDLEKLVRDFDYFNNEDLRNAEKISGNLEFNLDADAFFDDEGKLKMNSVNGSFQVAIEDLAIFNFKPVMESVVLLKKERFKKLQFRPIKQTFQVVNGEIIIPQTQIQSSAIQIFAEGKLKLGEYVNIWLSIPWNNILKKRDGLILPEKVSFEDSGLKFYLQLVQDKNGEKDKKSKLKTKFRLGKRKLEKEN
ncbi:AsmA-like C-terminal region [Gramella sp. MAR_2010_147]|nr:AsmA-like C-terminal region [Gramella sp. MAR_2010_147]